MPSALLPALVLAAVAAVPPAFAAETLVASLRGFSGERVRGFRFQVQSRVRVRIAGIGAGDGDALYAYAWLLDRDRFATVWSARESRTKAQEPQSRNLVFDDQVDLGPGNYALYYFAGGRHLAHGAGLEDLFGKRSDDPSRWKVELRVDADDAASLAASGRSGTAAPAGSGAEAPSDGAREIRLAPLGDSETRRRRFRVLRPVGVELFAVGEAAPRSRVLADWSWLLRLESREVVWSMSEGDSEHAGGAPKNRRATAQLTLEPGNYELVAATDDSHSADEWNSLPPDAPEDWGVTLRASEPALAGDVPVERTIVRLAPAWDEERQSATFRLDAPTRLRVRGLGEWSSGSGDLVDLGAIEDAATGASIWQMRYQGSTHAGGGAKNRSVDVALELPAGTYRARYQTDGSHSAGDWNASEPADPGDWGLVISTFDAGARFELLQQTVEEASEGHP